MLIVVLLSTAVPLLAGSMGVEAPAPSVAPQPQSHGCGSAAISTSIEGLAGALGGEILAASSVSSTLQSSTAVSPSSGPSDLVRGSTRRQMASCEPNPVAQYNTTTTTTSFSQGKSSSSGGRSDRKRPRAATLDAGAAAGGLASGEQQAELIELLAELYAHRKVKLLRQVELLSRNSSQLSESKLEGDKMDEDTLNKWLRQRQDKFQALKNFTVELVHEHPNRSINVCLDGPKILVLPDATDWLYCLTRDQWIDKLWADLRLSAFHYPIIALNILIFLFGTTGNIFVCLSVYRNHQLRSVTNYFIVNLAFADFLVILICLPATGVWDLSLTWFFGTIACKLIMFLQDVSISVSVLTLTAISLDRYYAICHPLKFKSNLSQAKRLIVLIWLVSLAIMSPDLIYLSARRSDELSEAGLDTVLYSDCNYSWTENSSKIFQFVKTILLYLLPCLLMVVAHTTILRTLRAASDVCHDDELRVWEQHHNGPTMITPPPEQGVRHAKQPASRQRRATSELAIEFHPMSRRKLSRRASGSARRPQGGAAAAGNRANVRFSAATTGSLDEPVESSAAPKSAEQARAGSVSSASQLKVSMHNRSRLESREKAAKMLVAIAVIFAICYLPVHLINFLRQFMDTIPQTDVTSTISMLAHCVCYLNSAINPIIYNHMNSIFRAEFKRFLSCLCWRRRQQQQQGPALGQTPTTGINKQQSIQSSNINKTVAPTTTTTLNKQSQLRHTNGPDCVHAVRAANGSHGLQQQQQPEQSSCCLTTVIEFGV